MGRHFKRIVDTYHISGWKSKGLSNERIKASTTSDNNLAPGLNYIGNKLKVKFVGS